MYYFKKYISIMLVFLLLVTLPTAVFASSPSQEYVIEQLLSMGVPHSFLESKEAEDIYNLYEILSGRDFVFHQTETVYLSESSEEDELSTCGLIPESEMTLSVTYVDFTEYDSSAGMYIVEEVMVFIDYDWGNIGPAVRKDDAITVNWDATVFTFKANSFCSIDYYFEHGTAGAGWVYYYRNNDVYASNQGGIGYYAELGSGLPNGNKGTAYFTLLPRDPMYTTSTGSVTSINVQYTHDKTPIFGSISFGYQGFQVTVTPPVLNDSVAKTINYHFLKM